MKQQKKVRAIQNVSYGLLGLCGILFFYVVTESEEPKINLTALDTLSIFIIITSAVFVMTAIFITWFISRLVKEVLTRRREDCDLYLCEAAVKESTNGVVITDNETRIVFVNPAFEKITGFSAKEVLGQTTQLLSSGHHDKAFFKQMWKTLKRKGHWEGEIWNRRKNGELYLEWINIIKFKPGLFHSGQYLGIFSDITERKQEEGQQAFQATHDPLTRLPNRNLFFDRVESEFIHCHRDQSKMAMLFLDLDEFKTINDLHGHIVGDQVLIDVSNRIMKIIRQSDSSCRYGGDEFIVLLPGITNETAWLRIVNTLLESIRQPYVVNNHILKLSVSIGVAVYDAEDGVISVSDFINMADQTMYKAKLAGKNGFEAVTVKEINQSLERA